ncbi:MAG: hypothetical protein R3230_01145 [Nitrosopumilaceae archaeon]|nr:hypothetical protein [Nitrosopumilaceae archaeon]
MVSKNDVTGDLIQSKGSNDNYRNNFDNIFKKRKEKKTVTLCPTPAIKAYDYISAVSEHTGKPYDVCESAAINENLYPSGFQVFIYQHYNEHGQGWFALAVKEIMRDNGISKLMIYED